MLERAPQGSCRLLVWFTDGIFDIDYISGPKTVYWTDPPTEVVNDRVGDALGLPALGRLCDAGGLAEGDASPGRQRGRHIWQISQGEG